MRFSDDFYDDCLIRTFKKNKIKSEESTDAFATFNSGMSTLQYLLSYVPNFSVTYDKMDAEMGTKLCQESQWKNGTNYT